MLNGAELLRGVDFVNREKNVSREVIFSAIEKAVRLAIHKSFDDDDDTGVEVAIDRSTGEIAAKRGEQVLEVESLGRIAAQAAKQMIIQLLKEEESAAVFNEYYAQKGDLITGMVRRFDGGAATVSIGKTEALLPRGEQIPGETHHVDERVKAVILDVRKQGHRVRIILSRTHADFVKRLFEQEIPEISDQTIAIKAIAREAGYRTKVAVSSIDMKVDCVGACVGVRGSRIKNIVDELGGERIDIVRWNDSLQVLIPNALQPASIEEVFLYPRLGRAIVLVKEDQLSLAIGRRGQNVRLASKLVGWDIEIMTHDELNESIDRAVGWFGTLPHVTEELVEAFIEEGFLSFDDLTFLEPAQLAELAGVTEEQAEEMIQFAEEAAERVEEETRAAKAEEASRPAQAPTPRPTARETAEALFATPSDTPTTAAEPKMTAAQLFGPDPVAAPPEEPALSATEVFNDQPPPPELNADSPTTTTAPPSE